MTEFFWAYGLFLAKVLTGLVAIAAVIAMIAGSRRQEEQSEVKVTHLNEKYESLKQRLMQATMPKKAFKEQQKALEKERKEQEKAKAKEQKKEQKKSDDDAGDSSSDKPNLYVLNFEGDIKASQVDSLRDEVTAVLSVATEQDEIFLRLDNSGGIVHEHGLAASQLQRIKDAGLKLTVSVDKVAASGGYMMACVGERIVAAPFAILGSIGVLAQLPNFNRLLDKAGIDFEQHTAGKYKRTVTMFGKNSDSERKKLKQELEETHDLFKAFVSTNRPELDLAKVATGEHWYGTQALDLGLVDEIKTSDQYLVDRMADFALYEINIEHKKPLSEKIVGGFFGALEKLKAGLSRT